MPSATEEVWRYVEIDVDLDDLTTPDAPGTPFGTDDVLADSLGDTAGSAHVVDGFTTSVEHDAPGGVLFSSLASALTDHEAEVRGAYGQGIAPDLDKFSAAHHAFVRDGVFLYVPSGVAVDRPFYVDVQASAGGAVSFPRITLVVEDGAQASVVVNYRSPEQGGFVVVPQVEASVRDHANLTVSVVQNWGYDTRSFSQARFVAGRDATVRLAEAGLGGIYSRLHLFVDLLGRGSSAAVLGAYFGEEDQTLDYRYFMRHSGLNTTSDMFLKGAVEDRALSVFTGMIRIDEGAQRTNAFQTNRNLILSEGAGAQSVPNLEILANDVRCGHGSTVGPLDEEQRYYLMSRGLDRASSDRLQVRGFFEEALGRFPEQAVADPVRTWMNRKFVTAQQEGRVS
jgi:Fe-S cluster assembly protein SufD